MTTISVPLSSDLMNTLGSITNSTGASKASIMRKALEYYSEMIAVNTVLLADNEPTLHGDISDLLAKI